MFQRRNHITRVTVQPTDPLYERVVPSHLRTLVERSPDAQHVTTTVTVVVRSCYQLPPRYGSEKPAGETVLTAAPPADTAGDRSA